MYVSAETWPSSTLQKGSIWLNQTSGRNERCDFYFLDRYEAEEGWKGRPLDVLFTVVQIVNLLYLNGPKSEHIVKYFPDDDSKEFDELIARFDEKCIPKKLTIFERAKFGNRVHRPGENTKTFIHALYENWEIGDQKDSNIRDSIVIDKAYRIKLFHGNYKCNPNWHFIWLLAKHDTWNW